MAATPSVKVIKRMNFKGGTRLFSNRYHFNGGTPADGSHWNTLFDAITTAEKAIFTSDITIVQAIGYNAGSDVPVASKTYSLSGTLSSSGNLPMPGECAAILRYSTAARTTKNHPVYLFNYFHGARCSSISGTDGLFGTQRTAIETYAGSWISGFSDGSITAVRAGPNGAAATGHETGQYVTHRDFPYSSSV